MSNRKKRLRFSAEHVLLVLLTVVCAVLAWQNYQLKHKGRGGTLPPLLKAGEVVPAVRFTSSDGTLDSLAYDRRYPGCFVLAVLRPFCPGCVEALPFWANMSRRMPAEARLIALSVGSRADVDSMLLEVGSTIDVGILEDPSGFADAYKISAVPATVVVAGDGRVLGAWMGPTNEATAESIMSSIEEYAEARQTVPAYG